MTTIEVTAKKIDDAIKQGLEQLGATLDEVNVEVVEPGGLFRKAKVRLTLEREEAAKPEKQSKQEKTEPPQKREKPVQPKDQKSEQPKPEKQPKQERAKPENTAKPQEKREKPQKPKPQQQNAEIEKSSAEYKEALAQAAEFVTAVVQKMGFAEASVSALENGDIAISAPSGDDSLIIGRHGETLSALSFIAETLGRAEKRHINIVVDCNGYRERRAASLTAMAKRRADECVSKRRKIKLEPMERVDRRTIHNALTGDDRVITSSEGKEPYRCVVILPKRN